MIFRWFIALAASVTACTGGLSRRIDRDIDGLVFNPTVWRTLIIATGLLLALVVAVQIGMRCVR